MSKIIEKLNSKHIYKIVYLVVSLYFTLSINTYLNISSILGKIMIIWGVYLLIYEIFINKVQSYTKSHWILLFFTFIYLLSTMMNINQKENIKILIVVLLEFFVLFSIDKDCKQDDVYRNIYIYSFIFVIISFIGSFISAFAYLIVDIFKMQKNILIVEGKFSGIFTNGNSLGILAVISIMVSIVMLNLIEDKKLKSFLYINCIIQLVVMHLTNTRSAVLGGAVYLIVLFVLQFRKKKHRYIVTSILLVAFGYFIFVFFNKKLDLNILLSGRYEIWIEALKLIKSNLILGIGNFNIVPMLKSASKLPLLGIEYGGLHNIYLQVILANGIIALITIVIFMVYNIFSLHIVLENLNYKDQKIVKCIISMMLSLMTINFFESNLVYIVSFIGFTLWVYLGYAFNLLYCNLRSKYY